MVSEKNAIVIIIIIISIPVALIVGAAVYQYIDLPSWVGMAVFIGPGIVVPTRINEFRRQE